MVQEIITLSKISQTFKGNITYFPKYVESETHDLTIQERVLVDKKKGTKMKRVEMWGTATEGMQKNYQLYHYDMFTWITWGKRASTTVNGKDKLQKNMALPTVLFAEKAFMHRNVKKSSNMFTVTRFSCDLSLNCSPKFSWVCKVMEIIEILQSSVSSSTDQISSWFAVRKWESLEMGHWRCGLEKVYFFLGFPCPTSPHFLAVIGWTPFSLPGPSAILELTDLRHSC